MRWFWLFILSLIVLTGVLFSRRVQHERAMAARLQEQADAQPDRVARRSRPDRPARRPERESGPEPETAPTPQLKPAPGAEPEPAAEPTPAPEPEARAKTRDQTPPPPEPATESDPEPPVNKYGLTPPVGDIIIEGLPRPADEPALEGRPQPDTAPEPTAATTEPESRSQPDAEPAPTFERLDGGSFRVLAGDILVTGDGSAGSPYRLSWDLLKSVENDHDPKNGDESLPGWLDLLDGKAVSIEGHTLVPVIADTTRELLVMQNPWDGCCIGVPPSPYDAIEVTLDHDVDFGSSAVGYGTVTGTFYLDPYVVDGWVLGLYIIENGQYRSGEGVSFPEF